MKLLKDLKLYNPINEQEKIDKQSMISFIERNPDCLERSNVIAHFTSSSIIMNEKLDKVLFVHHNIYNSWAWTGGHNDGNDDCLEVAIKEAIEETGIQSVKPLSNEIAGIDTIYVMQHRKNGKLVNDHLHLNLTYILLASEEDKLVVKQDENSGVRWFSLEEVYDYVTEPRMIPIYRKLIDKASKLKKKD